MSTELVAQQPQKDFLVDMNQWNQMREQCSVLVKTGFLPKGIDTPEKAMAVALKSRELGIGMMAGFEGLCVVNQKIAMEGKLALALIRSRVPGAIFDVVEHTNQCCRALVGRPGSKTIELSFSMDDAKLAGLLGKQGPWQQYPKLMLQWRVVAQASKLMFSDVTLGMDLKDELETIDVEAISVSTPSKGNEVQNKLAQLASQKPKEAPPQQQAPKVEQKPEPHRVKPDPEKINEMFAAFAALDISQDKVLSERLCLSSDDLTEEDMEALRKWYEKEKTKRGATK